MINDERKEEIRRGIAAYQRQQDTLIQVIKEHGGRLTAQEFNNEFSWSGARKNSWGFCALEGHTFILGGMNQGTWAKWLDLLQNMITVGLVNVDDERGVIVYSLP